MTYRELRRKLERLGCRFDRQASGSHEIWLNPANELQTPLDTMQGASQFSNYEVAYLNSVVR